ncbi:DUF1203 domain-containing protein [Brevundimonas staleyi]|uniref:DUF1203 domain-containing protein n=1 Tax=Brevundimonas staleyi TaxID=74326 RepID=A0ABW0FVM6_9CAUL
MTWRIEALPLDPFTRYFAMTDAELAEVGARRMIADAPNSAPCRVSLRDADVGDALILVNHAHLTAPSSPYRQAGPIFVREIAEQSPAFVDAVPDMVSTRLVSARAFDRDAMMLDADVVPGADLAPRLDQWFADPAVDQVQIHTARRGCYLARAVRQEMSLP